MTNAPEMNQHQQDPDSFLMGGGVPSASFHKLGDSCTGVVSEKPVLRQQTDMATNQPKTWDNGDPMMQLVVTLQTDQRDPQIEDDDGRRRIYVKFNLKNAVADAVRKAKAKSLEVGGKLTVTYIKDGEATQRGFNPPKFYSATYSPPASAFLDDNRPEPGVGSGPAHVVVDQKLRQEVWTFEDAMTAVLESGITRDEFLGYLKSNGLSKWVPGLHTILAQAFIKKHAAAGGSPIGEEIIPFSWEPWIPA